MSTNGYWKNDGNDNFYFVSFSGIGIIILFIFGILMLTMTEKISPFFSWLYNSMSNNLIVLGGISIVETLIVFFIFQHKFIFDYIFNAIHFFLVMIALIVMSKWIAEVDASGGFFKAIEGTIEIALRLIVSGAIFLISTFVILRGIFSVHLQSYETNHSNWISIFMFSIVECLVIGLFYVLKHSF